MASLLRFVRSLRGFLLRQPTNLIDGLLLSGNHRFTYKEIKKMTNNFLHRISENDFGEVYMAYLGNGVQIAVMVTSQFQSLVIMEEFQTEVQILTRVHHKNVISAIGYCTDKNHLAIVYEIKTHGNLQMHLQGNGYFLGWKKRVRIALGVAEGLDYLHRCCKPPIIHRDVKPSNIMLNEELEAVLVGFGLALSFNKNSISDNYTTIAGTFGYIDPEYCFYSRLTEKSDVYSFGVVLMQLITGLPSVRSCKVEDIIVDIVEWVQRMIANGDLRDVIDPTLQNNCEENSVRKVLDVALKCVKKKSSYRPTMYDVVLQLKEALDLELGIDDSLPGTVDLHEESEFETFAGDEIFSVDSSSEMSPVLDGR